MAFDARDRRRVTLAVLMTLLAAPVIALASASDTAVDDATDDTVVIDPEAVLADEDPDSEPNLPPTTAPGATPPVFMDGEEPEPGSQTIAIAVPPRPSGERFEVEATYSSTVPSVGQCLVDGTVPTGRTVTVVNLNNGLTATCTTALGGFRQTAAVVLHTELFATIADVTDAPVSVEVQL